MFDTNRLTNRPFVETDFLKWQSAHLRVLPKQNDFDDAMISKEKLTKDFFDKIRETDRVQAEIDHTYTFYSFSKDENILVGGSQLWSVQRHECQRATLGFWVFNNHWRKGYGLEIALGTILFGFNILKLNRIEAEILPENKPSIALCEKLGMTSEGIRREALQIDGKWRDHVVYSILKSDLDHN